MSKENGSPRWVVPEGVQFYLDDQGAIWVRLTDPEDGRRFPVEAAVIQSLMRNFLAKQLGRKGSPSEWEEYKDFCYASAIGEFRQRRDNADLRLERNTLIVSILAMMELRAAGKRLIDEVQQIGEFSVPEAERYEWVGSQTALRAELALFNNYHSDWPVIHKGQFGEYLEDHREQLWENNLVLTWVKRRNRLRPVCLSWRDITQITPYVPDHIEEIERLAIVNRALKDSEQKRQADLYRILHGE